MNTNDNNDDDNFKLDLDATCAATHKRVLDMQRYLDALLKEELEPVSETSKACGADEEAFKTFLEHEHGVSCMCALIKKIAGTLETKLNHKELVLFACFHFLETKAMQLTGQRLIAAAMKDIKEAMEQQGEQGE